jgi:hypothetical protein
VVTTNVLSTFAQAGAIRNAMTQESEMGLGQSVADAQRQDGGPVAVAAALQGVMDEANRGRQAA